MKNAKSPPRFKEEKITKPINITNNSLTYLFFINRTKGNIKSE